MRPIRRLMLPAAAGSLALVTACSTYRPARAAIPRAAAVRVRFADPRDVDVVARGDTQRFARVSRLAGVVESVRGDTVWLHVTDVPGATWAVRFQHGGSVAVVRDPTTVVETVRFSERRTLALMLVTTAGVLLTAFAILISHGPAD